MSFLFGKKFSTALVALICGFLLVELGLRVAGYLILSLQEHNNTISMNHKGAYRIMCIGESTTAFGGDKSYPSQLEHFLNQANLGLAFSVINKGLPGSDSSIIVSQLENNIKKYKPQMIIAMMGINDPCREITDMTRKPIQRFLKNIRIVKLFLLISKHAHEKISPAIEPNLNFSSSHRYYDLAMLHAKQDKLALAEKILRKALEEKNASSESYINLGQFYLDYNRYTDAEVSLKRAIALNPNSPMAYFFLGKFYHQQNRPADAEQAFQKAIELNPNNYRLYLELGRFYFALKKYKSAELILKKAFILNPGSERTAGSLSVLYETLNQHKRAVEFKNLAEICRNQTWNPFTARSYQELEDIAEHHKLQLVCVQYPMRDIVSLTQYLRKNPGVIAIDNEKSFLEAVIRKGYHAYFSDMFAGDFGHCTQEGNAILAENIATTIINNFFSVKSKK